MEIVKSHVRGGAVEDEQGASESVSIVICGYVFIFIFLN